MVAIVRATIASGGSEFWEKESHPAETVVGRAYFGVISLKRVVEGKGWEYSLFY